MKNRPFSLALIALSLAAWLAQLIMQYSISPEMPPRYSHDLGTEVLVEVLPYAVLCSIAAAISLPGFANWLLCGAVLFMGAAGVSAWMDYANGGGCMRGLALLMGYLFQCMIAAAGILLALSGKAVVYFQNRRARRA